MDIDWGTVLGTGFGGAMLYSVALLVKTLIGKRIVNADAAAKLSNSANEMIKAVRDDAERSIKAAYAEVDKARQELDEARKEARLEVNEARMEAAQARREAVQAQREAAEARRSSDESLYLVQRLTRAIMSPYATVEGLRDMVSGLNGSRIVKPSE